jgi:hypothetical protein
MHELGKVGLEGDEEVLVGLRDNPKQVDGAFDLKTY